MRRLLLALLPAFAGCSLLVDTSGLTGGSLPDAGSDAASSVVTLETPTDATPKVDAAVPTGEEDAAVVFDAAEPLDDGGTDAAVVDPLASSRVAEWKFEDDTTTAAMDATGHGHNGIVSGGKHVTGKYGQALELGGQGSIAIPATHDFDRPNGKELTITAWVKLGSLSPDHSFVFAVGYGSNAVFGLEIRDPSHIDYYAGDLSFGADGHTATSPVNFGGTWAHLATVVSGASVKMYFNGVPAGTGTADTTPRTAQTVTLGSDHLGAALDNVRFYDRALSDHEIADDRDAR